ncbi:MAG: cell division protein FtsP [Arsenophonus sp.]|nr:cell division protein FtsP [Arsenophonus sp.]
MSLSRRRFLKLSSIAMSVSMLPAAVRAEKNEGYPLLPIPPLLESHVGQPLFLTLKKSYWSFDGSHRTNTIGCNGYYLGPTIRVENGSDLKLVYSNRLSEEVAMTVSGLQVPGTQIGGAARLMSPNVDWSPVLPIRQPAATCWYHANTPGKMAKQIHDGLVGMWIVSDKTSKNLNIPNHYGVDDFPIIMQDKRLDSFGAPHYKATTEGFLGDTLLVNGVQEPYIKVARGWLRLRLLNASNSRRYILEISDKRPFYLIGSDQGLLPAPVSIERLPMAPGERREVLIDMSKTELLTITAGRAAGVMDRIKGLFEPSTLLNSTKVLTICSSGLLSLVTDNLPETLVNDTSQITSTIRNREVILSKPFGINGMMRDVNRIDLITQQGAWERWTVKAHEPQAFHIEGVRFKVINHNGVVPGPEDYGWKDTVWINGYSELLVNMLQPSYDHFPFLYFSQNLEKADKGSVAQMVINPST